MPRTLTKNSDGDLVFTEEAFDPNGDDLTHPIKVELDAVDGTTQTGSDRRPSWLSTKLQENGLQSDGEWKETMTVIVDASALSAGTTYTFLLKASDGNLEKDLLRDLTVQ